MNKISRNVNHGLAAFFIVCMAGISPTYADDVKIYKTTATNSTIQPNILFILDTSGSMWAPVDVPVAYDSSTTYSGGGYRNDYVYWEHNTNYGFPANQNNCLASASALSSSGEYTGSKVAAWKLTSTSVAGPDVFVPATTVPGRLIPAYTVDERWYKKSNNATRTQAQCTNWRGRLKNSCGYTPGYDVAAVQEPDTVTPAGWVSGEAITVTRGDWVSLDRTNPDRPVECSADVGVHGSNASPNDNYPTSESPSSNTTGLWQSAETSIADSWDTRILSSGNYLNYLYSGAATTTKSRMQVVKDVTTDLINTISGVNVGIMRFDNDASGSTGVKGGSVIHAIEDVDTARGGSDGLLAKVASLQDNGGTPLAEVLYEAALYYRGETVDYGRTDGSLSTPVSDAGTLNPSDTSKYKSPIEDTCQVNNIIYLSDGDPSGSYDTQSNSDISTMMGGGTFSGNRLDELAVFLHEEDQIDDSVMAGSQTINTYTIGFDVSASATTLLKAAATANDDDSDYFVATNTSNLQGALQSIIYSVLSNSTTFTAPAVSVNAFNSLEHRDELYFALFEPSLGARWHGNLKRYRLNSNGVIVDNSLPEKEAIGTDGYYTDEAKSFWSSDTDGAEVRLGGAAEQLPLTRNIYTYTGDTPTNIALNAAQQDFSTANTSITAALLGITGDPNEAGTRADIINWTLGSDVDADPTAKNYFFADPLHSQPVVVSYGGTNSDPDSTVYVTTNQGFLHAINTSDGSEVFSFIPKELLGNLDEYYSDTTAIYKSYGLDGTTAFWFNDLDGDGLLYDTSGNLDSGEHVYLYLTMRRGGNNIYALDVTNRSAPVLKWVIKGGEGDFTKLGQTWSQPKVAKVKFNGADRQVLIFGGGYDVDQDGYTERSADDVGNAIYMVDASTGERLWWSSATGSNKNIGSMSYSIPAGVTAIDVDTDGYTDRFFAADMGGQILRFDINSSNTGASNFISGAGVIANLATSGSSAGHRRFYSAPDIALMTPRGKAPFLTISIGSGFRADPVLKTNSDRFYMIRDYFPFSQPTTYNYGKDTSGNARLLTEADLFDTTDNEIEEGTEAEKLAALTSLSNAQGWYIALDASIGEKVLSESVTFAGQLVFTTYLPEASANPCSAAAGASRLYIVDLLTAVASRDSNNNGTYSAVERYNNETLKHSGIAPKAVIIYNPNSTKRTLCVGTECLADDDNPLSEENPFAKTYWRENQ